MRNRKVVEKLLADPVRGPSDRMKRMVEGYTAGLNTWIAERGRDGVTDPECRGARHLDTQASPVDLWYGLYLANILASTGHFPHQIVSAAPASRSEEHTSALQSLMRIPS